MSINPGFVSNYAKHIRSQRNLIKYITKVFLLILLFGLDRKNKIFGPKGIFTFLYVKENINLFVFRIRPQIMDMMIRCITACR